MQCLGCSLKATKGRQTLYKNANNLNENYTKLYKSFQIKLDFNKIHTKYGLIAIKSDNPVLTNFCSVPIHTFVSK